jgi:DNA-binding transcriptional ArsR family regulator
MSPPPCWRCLRIVVQAIVQRLCVISWWHGKLNKMVEDEVLDRTYAALADPTRRAVLVALRTGDARITDLAAPLPMTFAGVSRHIGVLESAGLVQRAVRGREHWLSIRPEGLSAAEGWINEQTAFWSRRADALASRLARKKSAGD